MAIFRKGNDATKVGNLIPASSLKAGGEYIFKYHVPPISFAVLSEATIGNWITEWFNIKKRMNTISPDSGEPVITVTGITVDSKTGDIWVRARINKINPQINQAGVNPYAIFATVAVLFGLLGFAVTLMGVYEVGNTLTGTGRTPTVDPCSQTGVIATIKCWSRTSAWVGAGIGIGVLVTLVLLLFLVGRSPNA